MLTIPGLRPIKFLRAGASFAAMTVALAFPVAAQAQEQPAADAQAPAVEETASDEIVVTGFRNALNSALNIKREAAGVVDAIKAEDIADFPDNNLAESLQRIPGVAIARDAGEGRQISVRGLGSDFTRIRINGMEALATTGGTDASGGANRSRGFDFNVFASELFNSLTVRKSASAEVEEGSLGATVDLQTARPFDFRDDFTLAVSGQLGYNDLSKSTDPRASLLVGKKWLDGRLGFVASVAYSERGVREEGAQAVRWQPTGAGRGFNPASTLPGYTIGQINTEPTTNGSNVDQLIFAPRIPRYGAAEYDMKRLGITASLQFQATDRTLLTIDGLYGDYDQNRTEQYVEAISFSRATTTGKPEMIIRDGVVDANNNLVYGVFDDVDMRSETRYDVLSTTFKQISGTIDHEFSDDVKLQVMAGTSTSKFKNPIQTTITLDRLNSDGYSYDFRQNDRLPIISLGFDPMNPANWSFINGTSEIRLRPQYVDNSFDVVKGNVSWQINDALRLKAGGDWRKYNFDSEGYQRISAETVVPTLSADQIAQMTEAYKFGRNLGQPSTNVRSFLIPNLQAFANALNIYSNTGIYQLGGVESQSARGNFRIVTEQDLAGWVQGEFETELFGLPFRGDVGVRVVETKQKSAGYTGQGATIALVRAKRSYTDVLPSMNLVAEVTDDFLIRFGAAKVLTRPGIGSLNPGGNFAITGNNIGYSSGNPNIDPTKANNVDLSFEWYPSRGSLFGVGLFYKDIGSFVTTLRNQVRFSALNLPPELLTGALAGTDPLVEVTQPVNSKGGELKGVEINFQQQFSFLPAPFNNMGILANYTYVDSKIEYPRTGLDPIRATLTGLSKHGANGTLYYEDDVFSIRGSVSYRSGFLTAVPGQDSNSVHGTNSTINVDMSASVNLTEQLSLTFEGINLTDEFQDQYVDESNRLNYYMHTGRQFYAGFRYKF